MRGGVMGGLVDFYIVDTVCARKVCNCFFHRFRGGSHGYGDCNGKPKLEAIKLEATAKAGSRQALGR